MTMMEKKLEARRRTLEALTAALESLDAVQFGDAEFAVLQEVDGQEIWTSITVQSKSYTATKVSPAFDPFEVAEIWKEEKATKAKAKAEREAEKERKRKAKEKDAAPAPTQEEEG